MNTSRSARGLALPAAILIALVAVLALVASGALGRAADPTPPPSGSPSAPPTEQPTASPTDKPGESPSDGKIRIPLENATDHDVTAVIDDATGKVVEVRSGKPGDGMSVRWHDYKVENVDDTTVRIVWVGLPYSEDVDVTVSEKDGAYAVEIVQKGPVANSDAVGYDRILVVEFGGQVKAEDVEVTIKDR